MMVLAIAASMVAGGPAPVEAAEPSDRPDIVVVMLDDMGLMPARQVFERLPRIREFFLRRGQEWTRYFGNDPLCCPGRANFLTGQTASHHGVQVNDARLLAPEDTVAAKLDAVGYHTMIAGKYLNLAELLQDHHPAGWDRASIVAGHYYEYDLFVDGVHRYRGSRAQDYSTDVAANHAVRMLGQAPADEPLFLMFDPFAPHGVMNGSGVPEGVDWYQPLIAPRHAGNDRCNALAPYRPPSYNVAEGRYADRPLLPYESGYPLHKVCRSLLSVDEAFGRIRDWFAANGRLSNTIFLLTSDNGMTWGEHAWPLKTVPGATPTPLWVRWPRVLGGTGSVNATFAQNIDWAPTLCELGGCTMGPYRNGQQEPDGISLVPALTGGTLDREYLFEERLWTGRGWAENGPRELPGWRAVRTTDASPDGLWHYIAWDDGYVELYDLEKDPWEMENLAGAGRPVEPGLAATLESDGDGQGEPAP
jgi:arylsulfatase A-like enzyme